MSKNLKDKDMIMVRSDLNYKTSYNGLYAIDEMLDYAGKMVKIYGEGLNLDGEKVYRIYDDGRCFFWNILMFDIDSLKEYQKNDIDMDRDKDIQKEELNIVNICETKVFTYKKHYINFTENNLTTGEICEKSFSVPEKIGKVIYNNNATIVILNDGSKGVAKCCPNDIFDKTIGIKIAYNRAKIKSLQKELKKIIQ
jgi:hypothetical protein